MDPIDRWHDLIRTRDPRALQDLLDADAIFESPVVHAPQVGRDIAMRYLLSAMQVLGNDAFRYVGEWRSPDGGVLEFVTELDGVTINGVDIIRFTTDGQRIANFKVMVRPRKALEAVQSAMGALLAQKSQP